MKEADIRPAELVEKYIDLSRKDAQKLFNTAQFERYSCEACGHLSLDDSFKKFDFQYGKCPKCSSVYLNPRPTLSSFAELYADSESAKFWSEIFFPAVAEQRRNAVFKPRVLGIKEVLGIDLKPESTVIDVGAGYGIFLEEFLKQCPDSKCVAIEPSDSLSEVCKSKGIDTRVGMLEEVEGLEAEADLVTCFEVLEHVHSPLEFLRSIFATIKPDGYAVITTLTVDGFDLLTLSEHSMQISPPHHINFFTLEGIRKLFLQVGFSDVRIDTPGKLDFELVVKSKEYDQYNGLFKVFFERLRKDENLSSKFQQFITENKLSSHVRVIARK